MEEREDGIRVFIFFSFLFFLVFYIISRDMLGANKFIIFGPYSHINLIN